MRVACLTVLAVAAAVMSIVPGRAAPVRLDPRSGDVVEQDFKFGDGERLATLDLHYVTLGAPVRDAGGAVTNGVMLLHGTIGNAQQFLQPAFADAMFGPGEPLDIGRFFVVIPDGIGAGGSSKPSDGLQARFPHYGYKDQVRAQHDLAMRLGLRHLRLLLGTSMGGMQAWLWGETYPEDADGLVAIASTPGPVSGRNMMWREMIIEAIEHDPDWKGGFYAGDHAPTTWRRTALPLFAIMTGDADHLQDLAPSRQDAVTAIDKWERTPTAPDAEDYLYALDSSADYDPGSALASISAPMLAINFADDLLNPPELLHLPALGNLSHVLIPRGSDTFGHQTLAHPAAWIGTLSGFLDRLPGWRRG